MHNQAGLSKSGPGREVGGRGDERSSLHGRSERTPRRKRSSRMKPHFKRFSATDGTQQGLRWCYFNLNVASIGWLEGRCVAARLDPTFISAALYLWPDEMKILKFALNRPLVVSSWYNYKKVIFWFPEMIRGFLISDGNEHKMEEQTVNKRIRYKKKCK